MSSDVTCARLYQARILDAVHLHFICREKDINRRPIPDLPGENG